MNCSCFKFALWLGLSLASADASHGQMLPVDSDFGRQPAAYPKLQRMITDCLHVIGTVDDETESQVVQPADATGEDRALEELAANSSRDASEGEADSLSYENDQYYAQPDADAQQDGYARQDAAAQQDEYAQPDADTQPYGYRADAVVTSPATQAGEYDEADCQERAIAPSKSIDDERYIYEDQYTADADKAEDAAIADEFSGSRNLVNDDGTPYDVKFREEREEISVPDYANGDEEGSPYNIKFREEVAGPANSAGAEDYYGYDAEAAPEPVAAEIVTPGQQAEPSEEAVETTEPSEYQADTETAPLDVRYDRQVMLGVADFLGQLGVALQNVSRQLYSLAAEDMGSVNR